MAGFHSIVLPILLLLTPYTIVIQAESRIFFPLDNTTYWSPGSLVQLPWTYNYTKGEITSLEWFVTKSGSRTQTRLAIFHIEAGSAKPSITDPTMFNITRQATLEFKNANLGNNGTYAFRVTLRNSEIKESETHVIILEQPTAVIKCCPSSLIVEEGEDITCLCNSTGGNPPATASWSKYGTTINGTGYLKKNLILKNISKEDTGTYNCTVTSHILTDTKFINITLKRKHKPRNISFSSNEPNTIVTSGDRVEITCKVDAYPEASYSILLNDSQLLTNAVDGSYNISSVNDSHAGNYTCVAKNIIGNVSAQLVLTVNVRPTFSMTVSKRTVNPSVSMSAPTSDTQGTGARPGGEEESPIAAIVGGAIGGGVVLVMICIVLICCYCKHSYGRNRIDGASDQARRSNEANDDESRKTTHL